MQRCATGAATLIPGAVFSGSLDGHIRAYDVLDGRILWDFDTAQNFKTVNLVEAHGGSINYAGTVVAGCRLSIADGPSRAERERWPCQRPRTQE